MATYTIETTPDQERGLSGATRAANAQIEAGNVNLPRAEQRPLLSNAVHLAGRVNDILDGYAREFPELPPVADMKAALDDASESQRARIAVILAEDTAESEPQ